MHKLTEHEQIRQDNPDFILYDIKLTVFPERIVSKYYHENVLARKKIKVIVPEDERISIQREEKGKGEIRDDNLHASNQKLGDLIENNEKIFTVFETFTYDPKKCNHTTDIDMCKKDYAYLHRARKRKQPDYESITVTEFQNNGNVHFHSANNVKVGSELLPERETLNIWSPQKNKWYSHRYYNAPHWNHGHTTALVIGIDTDENFILKAYMGKYMYSDKDHRLFGYRKWQSTQGLRQPKEQIFLSDTNDTVERNQVLNGFKQSGNIKSVPAKSQYARPFIISSHIKQSDPSD